ncbi:C-type mannose receptor 2-like [Oratosquilla oratoria]|uniref:C-type mannose receptor 2-like n=1 Tax=Oratosquilla oratoria TaxID=337810 RepID=UPI003F75CD3B
MPLYVVALIWLASLASTTPSPESSRLPGSCPPKFHRVRDRCYYPNGAHIHWQDCWDSCAAHGGAQIASLETLDEHEALVRFLIFSFSEPTYWVGGVKGTDCVWRWMSGVPLPLATLQWYHPPREYHDRTWIYLYENYKLGGTSDSDTNACLCETSPLIQCPFGYVEVNGLCLLFYNVKSTWSEAREWCRKEQGDLLVIRSRQEHDVVAGRIMAMELKDDSYWVGARAKVAHFYQWLTGDSLLFGLWKYGHPHTPDGCVQLNPNFTFHASDDDCMTTAYAICRYAG